MSGRKWKKMRFFKCFISAVLVGLMLCACGSNEEGNVVEESEAVSSVTEEQTETEKEEQEVQQFAEEETSTEEEVAEETYNGMPVAEIATTVSDIYSFLDYAESFNEPALLIYNENEGYVINMGDGEYYQLKKGDRIFTYDSESAIGKSSTLKAGGGTCVRGYVFEMTPDYSQYDSPHEVIYVVYFTEERDKGDYFLLTCYLDAPVE